MSQAAAAYFFPFQFFRQRRIAPRSSLDTRDRLPRRRILHLLRPIASLIGHSPAGNVVTGWGQEQLHV